MDKDCKLSWLQGRHFSVSACLAVGSWCCLLARLVTECHWPVEWTKDIVLDYLKLLSRLQMTISQDLGDNSVNIEAKNTLKIIFDDFSSVLNEYKRL